MTVNSYYYQKPTSASFLPKINAGISLKKIKRSTNNISDSMKNNKTGLSSIILGTIIGLCVVFISIFIYSQSINADLDYRITDLKNAIAILETENANLKTKYVENISSEAIILWAQQNNFVKNNSFTNFEISHPERLSLNTNN